MPLAHALKSFKGRYGHIRAGMEFNGEPGYVRALERKGWVKILTADPAKQPGPDDNRSIPEAPDKAGKVPAAPARGGSGVTIADDRRSRSGAGRKGGGRAITSRSLRQDLASLATTPTASDDGGTKTPDPAETPAGE